MPNSYTVLFDAIKVLPGEPRSLRMNALVLDHSGEIIIALSGLRIAKNTIIAPASKVGSGWLTIAMVGGEMAKALVRDFRLNENTREYASWLDSDDEKAVRWLLPDKDKLTRMFPAIDFKELL